MPVNILPQDTITPALSNVFGQLNNINLAKMQEETRKRNELADLTDISLQNISANDNIYLQKQKDQFLKDAAKSYGENKGYLPYETQAELNARKSNILMEAKASEEWKKQYEDVVKQMATSDKFDKEKTAANLKAMMFTNGEPIPPSQRPNPYNAVSLNFDTTEYDRQNLDKTMTKNTAFDPNDKRKIVTTEELTPENVYKQIQGFMNNASYKMKRTEEAREHGYDDVDKYNREVVAPDRARKQSTWVYHYPSERTGITNIFNTGNANTNSQPVTLYAGGKNAKDPNRRAYSVTPQGQTTLPPTEAVFNSENIVYADNTLKPKTIGSKSVEVSRVLEFPSINLNGIWSIVPDDKVKDYPQGQVVNRSWFAGQITVPATKKDKAYKQDVYVPAVDENVQLLNSAIKGKTNKTVDISGAVQNKWDNTPAKTSEAPPLKTVSLSAMMKDNPNYTADQIKTYCKNNGITLIK